MLVSGKWLPVLDTVVWNRGKTRFVTTITFRLLRNDVPFKMELTLELWVSVATSIDIISMLGYLTLLCYVTVVIYHEIAL
jgi:hypothetical protein